MATELRLTGVDELLADLARLAPDLVAEAGPLEQAIADQTAEAIRAAYPVVTGRLRASVQVQRLTPRTPTRVVTQVAVTAPYAELYEFGTARTTPHPTLVPAARRGRAAFVKAVIARVRALGLTVAGEPGA